MAMMDTPSAEPTDKMPEPARTTQIDQAAAISIPIKAGDGSADGELLGQVDVKVNLAPGDAVQITIEVLPEEGIVATPGKDHPGEARPLGRFAPRPARQGGRQARATALALAGDWSQRAFQALGEALAWLTRPRLRIGQHQVSFEEAFFGLALVVYLSTRLIGLVNFPIYFVGSIPKTLLSFLEQYPAAIALISAHFLGGVVMFFLLMCFRTPKKSSLAQTEGSSNA